MAVACEEGGGFPASVGRLRTERGATASPVQSNSKKRKMSGAASGGDMGMATLSQSESWKNDGAGADGQELSRFLTELGSESLRLRRIVMWITFGGQYDQKSRGF